MKSCPPKEALQSLIDDDIDAEQQVLLELHVSECSACRDLLMTALKRDDWRQILGPDSDNAFLAGMGISNEAAELETGPVASVPTEPESEQRSASSTVMPKIEGIEVLDRIGSGGMGTVYRGRQVRLGRDVAIKILHQTLHEPERWLRFRTEAKAIAQLQHPHVVQVFDTGHDARTSWIVQEFCGGGTLEDRIDGTPQSPMDSAVLVSQLAAAVQHAHDSGVIHRDIKPANVLFSDGVPRLADFGLARQLDTVSGVTQTGEVMGTPSYMSPEQATGCHERIGIPSDVYGLGAVLYEMLTGIPPFRAATAVETLRMVVEQDAVPPRRLQPAVPRDLEVICQKCLEKDASQRYSSASQLAEDLLRFVDGRPIHARPISTLRRVSRWARRRPGMAAMTALATMALAALIIVWGAFTARVSNLNSELSQANTDLTQLNTDLLSEKTAAEQGRQAAIRERNVAQGFSDFLLQDLLEQGSAQGQLDWLRGTGQSWNSFIASPSLSDIVLRSSEQIRGGLLETRFPGQPRVHAEIHRLVGTTCHELGQFEAAEYHLTEALTLLKSFAGADLTLITETTLALGTVLGAHAEASRAVDVLQAGYDAAVIAFGEDDPLTLRLAFVLAKALHRDVQFQRAVDLARTAADGLTRQFGDRDLRTLQALVVLSECERTARHPEESLALAEKAVDGYREVVGTDHPDYFAAVFELGLSAFEAQQTERSIAIWDGLLADSKRVLGAEHPAVMYYAVMHPHIDQSPQGVQSRADRVEQAEKVLRNTYAWSHPFRLHATTMLASVRGYQQRFQEALSLEAECAESLSRIYGPHDALVISSRTKIARFHRLAGDKELAISELRSLRKEAAEHLPEDSEEASAVDSVLCTCLFEQGGYDEIIEISVPRFAQNRDRLGMHSMYTLMNGLNLMNSYKMSGRHEQLLEIAVQFETARSDAFPPDDDVSLMIRQFRIAALVGLKNWPEAKDALLGPLELAQQKKPGDTLTLKLQYMLAEVLINLSEFEEAEQHLVAAWDGLQRIRASQPAMPRNQDETVARLFVQLAEKSNRPELAAQWKAELEALATSQP